MVYIRMLPDKRKRDNFSRERQSSWVIVKGCHYTFVFNGNHYPGVIKEMFTSTVLMSNQESRAQIELLPISPIGTYLTPSDKFNIIRQDLIVGEGSIQKVDYSVHPV